MVPDGASSTIKTSVANLESFSSLYELNHASLSNGLLVINGKIINIPVKILIDPGATDNFINPRVRQILNL